MSKRTVIVGLRPGKGWEPGDIPLVNSPSGRRLCDLMGITQVQLVNDYILLNLHPTDSDLEGTDVQIRVGMIEKIIDKAAQRVILLGQEVASAFLVDDQPLFTWHPTVVGYDYAIVPHPSGLNRQWNDPTMVDRARRFFGK